MGASRKALTDKTFLRGLFDQIRSCFGPARKRGYSSRRSGRNAAHRGAVSRQGAVSALWRSEAAGQGPAAPLVAARKLESPRLRAGTGSAEVAGPVWWPQLLAVLSGDSAACTSHRAVSAQRLREAFRRHQPPSPGRARASVERHDGTLV